MKRIIELQSNPKKILFISKGENASSTRYRALQYFPYFIESGWRPNHSTMSGGLLAVLKTFVAAKQADIVVLLRKTHPYPIFWILRRLSKKLIFDFDDAIFSNTDGSDSKTRMQRFKHTVTKCDMVFAGNQYLAERAKRFQPNTYVIPTSLAIEKYELTPKRNENQFILVWIGSQSTKKYIVGILPYIENAAIKIPQLQLKIIADFELKSDKLNIINIPWTAKIEASELCDSDIGLGPLPEDNWTKGKCGLKVLQYMAAGIPVITSPTSVNGYVITHDQHGFIVNSPEDWEQAIQMAYKQKKRLLQMGNAARIRVKAEFQINVVYQKIELLIQSE
jgi:glycosyltransferase involved in cell wall biosynthesis